MSTSKKKIRKPTFEGATRGNMHMMDPENVVIIGLDTDDDNTHPLYDERIKLRLNEALIKNLKVEGNKVPILVRKNGDVPEVVDGRQRVRCARQANKELEEAGKEKIQIKVLQERGEDADMFGILISTNEQRVGDSPMARARKVHKYTATMGRSKADAAIRFGVTGRTIDLWLRLMDLDGKVQHAIDAGKISAHAAGELADLPREEQVAKLEVLIADGASVNHADVVAAKASNGVIRKSKKPKKAVIKAVLDWAKIKADDNKKTGIPDDAYAAMLWMDGKLGPTDVPWLMKILRKIEEESDEDLDLISIAGTGGSEEESVAADA